VNAQSDAITMDSVSQLTLGDIYYMAGVGGVLVSNITGSTIRINNLGTPGNASPGATITSGKTIKSTTQLTWVFDLTTLPTNYTLERRASTSDPYTTIATLPNNFSQPFKDALPPSPTLYYRVVANMPASEGISFSYVLEYNPQSVT
jgi:hypothetical protein